MVCRHFGTCGGCSSQDLSYQEQLLIKQKSIEDLFASFAVFPILPAPHFHEYRNKMEFSFSEARGEKRFLGLMMKKGRVVDLQECLIAPKWMMGVLEAVRLWWIKTGLKAYFPPKDLGNLRTLTLREGVRTKEKMAILTTSNDVPEDTLLSFKKALLEVEAFTSIFHIDQKIQKKCKTEFRETLLFGKDHIEEKLFQDGKTPLIFTIRPLSFFQPHSLQAERLYNKAIELLDPGSQDTVLDLYCGGGSIGCFIASKVKSVIGIELNEKAVMDAKDNITKNHIPNMKVHQGDVGEALPLTQTIDSIIVDPPRCGLSFKALSKIKSLSPKKIVYISCNPKTQAENVEELLAFGYKILTIQPVDQFPHTPHIENIVVLSMSF